MWPVLDEVRKHLAFRETWVGYVLGVILLFVSVYADGWTDRWFLVQQDITRLGAAVAAFLIAVGLPRLICCEWERGTDCLIGASVRGRLITWRSKVIFTILYCALVVLVIGGVMLPIHGGQLGFEGAFSPVTECVYFAENGLPPMSNMAYCMLQYGFLFLGALYFAGFVLLVAAITRRTALTIFLCGGVYLVFFAYFCVGHFWVQGLLERAFTVLFRFSFSGFMLQTSYSWTWAYPVNWPGVWPDVWKPILMVVLIVVLEFGAFWLLWRRKASK